LVLPDYPNNKKITKQSLLDWINNTVQSKTLNIPVLENLTQQQAAIAAAVAEPNVFAAEDASNDSTAVTSTATATTDERTEPETDVNPATESSDADTEPPKMTELRPEITDVELNKENGDVNVRMKIDITPNQAGVIDKNDAALNENELVAYGVKEEASTNASTLDEAKETSVVPPKAMVAGGSRSRSGKKSHLVKGDAKAKRAVEAKGQRQEVQKRQRGQGTVSAKKAVAKKAPSTSRSTNAKHHKDRSL